MEAGSAEVYDDCIKALKEQYLDEPFIIDEYFKKLLADKLKTHVYIANTTNHLHNLKIHYKVDLLDESNSAQHF